MRAVPGGFGFTLICANLLLSCLHCISAGFYQMSGAGMSGQGLHLQ